jgi:Putative peptidoglycan binding domain/LysM domain
VIHTVKQGEYLSKIAKQYGFADYKAIWNHPENAEFKKKRKNPNILYAGDKLFVPVKEGKELPGATEQRHRFEVKRSPLKLRLVLKDFGYKSLANTKCVLHVDGEEFELTSDGNGMIEHAIPAAAEQARLEVDDPNSPIDLEVPIQIGHLDPVDTVSGQKARLNNLGYYAGPLDKEDEALFKSAVEEFQCDQKLTVDGKCGPKTQAKLKELYGC